MEWPKLKRDYIGLIVKTKWELENHHEVIPQGTICKVTYAKGGLTLKTKSCKCCKVAVYLRCVSEDDVYLVHQERFRHHFN